MQFENMLIHYIILAKGCWICIRIQLDIGIPIPLYYMLFFPQSFFDRVSIVLPLFRTLLVFTLPK